MILPATMRAMVTMGHGDLDQMVLHTDWPRRDPDPGEVLIRVGVCGLNNTDVNTRSGWYSRTVSEATTGRACAKVGDADPTWGGVPVQPARRQANRCSADAQYRGRARAAKGGRSPALAARPRRSPRQRCARPADRRLSLRAR